MVIQAPIYFKRTSTTNMSNYTISLEQLRANYYDPGEIESVLEHAQRLIGKNLVGFLSPDEISVARFGKGDFGNILEAGYFKIKNNTESRPDISESGIEIKSGQVKIVRGVDEVLKERLKISMIDYLGGFEAESLLTSTLWKKLEKILLLLFRKGSNSIRIEEICVYADLLRWTDDDIKQLSEDWLQIKNMVIAGKANELSEGHTWYLGACTAGANSNVRKHAPGGIQAKVRAFSLKSSYLNYKLGFTKNLKGPKVIIVPSKGQSLDEYILNNMAYFYGMSMKDIAYAIKRPELSYNSAKNSKSLIARALLEEISGTHSSEISSNFEQFRKAGVIEKTVTLEPSGYLKESVSFPAFKWIELNQEEVWEESSLYDLLTTKFFFTVFRKVSDDLTIFQACFFWTMPANDLEKMKSLWEDTKLKITENNYANFIRKTQHAVGHIRPHAKDSSDVYLTPQGTLKTKKSFWLNNDYLQSVIEKSLNI